MVEIFRWTRGRVITYCWPRLTLPPVSEQGECVLRLSSHLHHQKQDMGVNLQLVTGGTAVLCSPALGSTPEFVLLTFKGMLKCSCNVGNSIQRCHKNGQGIVVRGEGSNPVSLRTGTEEHQSAAQLHVTPLDFSRKTQEKMRKSRTTCATPGAAVHMRTGLQHHSARTSLGRRCGHRESPVLTVHRCAQRSAELGNDENKAQWAEDDRASDDGGSVAADWTSRASSVCVTSSSTHNQYNSIIEHIIREGNSEGKENTSNVFDL